MQKISAYILSDAERESVIAALKDVANETPTYRIEPYQVQALTLAARLENEPPDVEFSHDAGGSEDLTLQIHPLEDVHFSCPTCGTSVNKY